MKEKIQKKVKKISYFPVSDLINDDVKNRCIYPLFVLIFYVILVFLLINFIVAVSYQNFYFYINFYIFYSRMIQRRIQ